MSDERLRLFHIVDLSEYESRSPSGYKPSAFEAEGFVHLSTADQLSGVYRRYYAGRNDLLVLWIELSVNDPRLVFEDLTGKGEQFPHYYDFIRQEFITGAFPVNIDPDDVNSFELFFSQLLKQKTTE